MSKLTQEMLAQAMRRVVPPQYQVHSKEEQQRAIAAGKAPPVLHCTVVDDETFLRRVMTHRPEFHSREEIIFRGVLGICVNMGALMRRVRRPNWEVFRAAHLIYLTEQFHGLSALKLEFVLLHEIGHVDHVCRRKELGPMWPPEQGEVYADYYATERLTQVYDEGLAQTMAKLFASQREQVLDA